MNKEIADKWVADLLTNPPRCTGRLYDGVGYCPLGRLCRVLGYQFTKKVDGNYYVGGFTYDYLPARIMSQAGIRNYDGRFIDKNGNLIIISTKNDKGASFKEIARLIAENWERI